MKIFMKSDEKSMMNKVVRAVMHTDNHTLPDPAKSLKKVPWPPHPGKFKILFWAFLPQFTWDSDFPIEIEVQMQKSLKFSSLLCIFLNIFSCIMSYDRPMLLCIIVSICDPISIRYNLKTLIPYGKKQNHEKLHNFLKNFARILWKIIIILWLLH